jgi:hypothetical protein
VFEQFMRDWGAWSVSVLSLGVAALAPAVTTLPEPNTSRTKRAASGPILAARSSQ